MAADVLSGPRRRGGVLLATAIAVLAGALYVATLAPGLVWGDDAELQRFAAVGGTRVDAHLHPLWLWAAALVARLPVGSLAWRVNLTSAFLGALTIGLVFPFADAAQRAEGRDWPADGESMMGSKCMDNLHACIADVLQHGLPGDVIETGVWRGGAVIFMRAVLAACGDTTRRVWVADSFQGLPPPEAGVEPDRSDSHHGFSTLAVSLEQVKANFARHGLFDDRVRFLEGWFKDTLPGAPIEKLAVARLDGDMYASTMDALRPLYPKLSVGGYLIAEDYGVVPGCRQAIAAYRAEQGIREPIVDVDGAGVYWKRER